MKVSGSKNGTAISRTLVQIAVIYDVGGGEHWPFEQISPAGQLLLQIPQWSGSVLRLKHPSTQAVFPAGQSSIQFPFTQAWPCGHLLLQYPQLLLSVMGSVQFVPQNFRSAGQVPYFGVFTVVGISVGGTVVVGGRVIRAVVTGVSVSIRT